MLLLAIGVGGSGGFDLEVCRCLRSLAHVQICRCFCLLVQIQFLMVFANRWFATGVVPLLSGCRLSKTDTQRGARLHQEIC